MTKYLIGIDTGVNTGYAVAQDNGNGGELFEVRSLTITQAMSRTLELFIEDARKRTWFTGGREKAQGVGSVKRDAQIWEDWCTEQGINFKMIHPQNNSTKYKAPIFKKITGWIGRTNEHARDAAMLVHGRFARF